eukprot:jgi/Psemu1/18166/gm1.18166_g
MKKQENKPAHFEPCTQPTTHTLTPTPNFTKPTKALTISQTFVEYTRCSVYVKPLPDKPIDWKIKWYVLFTDERDESGMFAYYTPPYQSPITNFENACTVAYTTNFNQISPLMNDFTPSKQPRPRLYPLPPRSLSAIIEALGLSPFTHGQPTTSIQRQNKPRYQLPLHVWNTSQPSIRFCHAPTVVKPLSKPQTHSAASHNRYLTLPLTAPAPAPTPTVPKFMPRILVTPLRPVRNHNIEDSSNLFTS